VSDPAVSPNARTPSDVVLTPEQERAIDGAARWMGLLGRFQVLAGGLIALLVVVAALTWAINQTPSGEVESSTTPSLVRLGEVSTETLALSCGIILAFGLLLLRGGVLLTDAAEDLEHHVTGRFVEAGLGHLAGYFVTEIALVAVAIAVVLSIGAIP
jgi:hypothetical protein